MLPCAPGDPQTEMSASAGATPPGDTAQPVPTLGAEPDCHLQVASLIRGLGLVLTDC